MALVFNFLQIKQNHLSNVKSLKELMVKIEITRNCFFFQWIKLNWNIFVLAKIFFFGESKINYFCTSGKWDLWNMNYPTGSPKLSALVIQNWRGLIIIYTYGFIKHSISKQYQILFFYVLKI